MSFISTGAKTRDLRTIKLEAKQGILPALVGSSKTKLLPVGSAGSDEIGTKGPPSRPLGGQTKRALDITLALTLLVLLAPLMLIVTLLVSLTSPASVIFSQQRIGFKGRPFPCFKFRTMVPNAEDELRIYLDSCPEAARKWAEHRKLQYDPRISWPGKLLRKSSIDELPQLVNVLRGEMSLIGPRPIVADELIRYGGSQRDYLATRPGLTGMWQVSGRDRRSYQDRVALDRYYLRRWSIWLDLWILFNTIPAILRFDDAS